MTSCGIIFVFLSVIIVCIIIIGIQKNILTGYGVAVLVVILFIEIACYSILACNQKYKTDVSIELIPSLNEWELQRLNEDTFER